MKLQAIPGVAHAVVYGDNQSILSAVLSRRLDQSPLCRDMVAANLLAINDTLAVHDTTDSFVIADSPFAVENGLLTRVGKPSRPAV